MKMIRILGLLSLFLLAVTCKVNYVYNGEHYVIDMAPVLGFSINYENITGHLKGPTFSHQDTDKIIFYDAYANCHLFDACNLGSVVFYSAIKEILKYKPKCLIVNEVFPASVIGGIYIYWNGETFTDEEKSIPVITVYDTFHRRDEIYKNYSVDLLHNSYYITIDQANISIALIEYQENQWDVVFQHWFTWILDTAFVLFIIAVFAYIVVKIFNTYMSNSKILLLNISTMSYFIDAIALISRFIIFVPGLGWRPFYVNTIKVNFICYFFSDAMISVGLVLLSLFYFELTRKVQNNPISFLKKYKIAFIILFVLILIVYILLLVLIVLYLRHLVTFQFFGSLFSSLINLIFTLFLLTVGIITLNILKDSRRDVYRSTIFILLSLIGSSVMIIDQIFVTVYISYSPITFQFIDKLNLTGMLVHIIMKNHAFGDGLNNSFSESRSVSVVKNLGF